MHVPFFTFSQALEAESTIENIQWKIIFFTKESLHIFDATICQMLTPNVYPYLFTLNKCKCNDINEQDKKEFKKVICNADPEKQRFVFLGGGNFIPPVGFPLMTQKQ